MRIHSPLFLLAVLGVMSGTAVAATVDTSAWTCETCPYPKGTTGAVEVGVGQVSDKSSTFGSYTGLDRKGGHLVLGGELSARGPGGYYADLNAADLGTDIRRLSAQSGHEGLYNIRLGYAELPRYEAEGARTPFLGNGSGMLTLPALAGYPAGTTAAMPLASTLNPLSLGSQAKRFELVGSWVGQRRWTYRVSLRRDVHDGSKAGAGSFYATSSQLALPVDHSTDLLEVSATYATQRLQASLGYQMSQFRQGTEALTWANPFSPVVGGDSRGQLAMAPSNQFHQITGSAGYQLTPMLRASADIAVGRMTQNAAYLAATLNSSLLVPALPAASLDGRVDTFNANVKLSATPMAGLRVHAVYARDVRDNRTAVLSYPMVSTDMFLRPDLRSNTPFGLTQDRFKINADYHRSGPWKVSGGVDWDRRDRPYTEAVTTRETTLWGRGTLQAREDLSLSLKLAHAERDHSPYGITTWFGGPQNPLMRKYNLAARNRDSGAARADWTVNSVVSLGLGVDYARDDYKDTAIGLKDAETVNLSADLGLALSEHTNVHAFAQGERMRSSQAGSQTFGAPDWTGRYKDRFEVVGMGLKHAAIPDKLDIGADLSISRARSDIAVQTGALEPDFPTAKTSLDVVKLHATYKLGPQLSLTGIWWYERTDARDWRLDTVQPATVSNLLAFGNPAPNYNVNVLRLVLRYGF